MKKNPSNATMDEAGASAQLAVLADDVAQARVELEVALGAERRRWPRVEFHRFEDAVRAYAKATEGAEFIHRSVAASVSGVREYLELMGRRVPGSALAEADRLEVILFGGYDPHFTGFEPPGL